MKMNCALIKDILPLYVDDVVSEETKKIVSQHLDECELCRKEWEFLTSDIKIPLSITVQRAETEVLKREQDRIKKVSKKAFLKGATIVLIGMFVMFLSIVPFIYMFFLGGAGEEIREPLAHTEEEIEFAMDTVKEEFKNDSRFEGCRLYGITYDLGYIDNLEWSHGDEYSDKEILLLATSFKAQTPDEESEFVAGEVYNDWLWVFVEDVETREWVLEYNGY